MRQIFLVAVNANQVLEGARDARFSVRLQFGEVDDNVGFDHFFGDQVLVDTGVMRPGHKPGIIAQATRKQFPAALIGSNRLWRPM